MSWEVGDDEWLAQPNAAQGSGPVDDLDDRVIRSLSIAAQPSAGFDRDSSDHPAASTEPPVEAYALSSDDLPPPPYSAAFDADQESPSYESGSFVSEPESESSPAEVEADSEAASDAEVEEAAELELDFHIPTLSLGAMASEEPNAEVDSAPVSQPEVADAAAGFVIPTLSATPVVEAAAESGEAIEELVVEEVAADELEEVEVLVEEQPVRTGDTVIARAPEPDPASTTITASVYDEEDDDDDDDSSGLVIPELVERVDSSELELVLEDSEVDRASVLESETQGASSEFVIPNLARPEPIEEVVEVRPVEVEAVESDAGDELVIPSLVLTPSTDAEPPAVAVEVEPEPAELHGEDLHEVDADAIESLDPGDLEEVEHPVAVEAATESSEPKPPTPPEIRPQAKRRKAWYDDVFAEHFLFLYPLTWEHTCERDAQFIFTLIGGQEGASVLDVGCGDGRHAVELAKLGARVTGLDNSLALLLAAAQTKESAGIEDGRVDFIHGDMRRLPRDRDFDAVICVGTTLGYFEEEQNWLCLQEMHDRLRPGGRLLIHVFNRDFVAPHLPSRSWWQGKRCMVIDEAEMNFFANRLRVHRTIIFDDGRQYEHYMFMRAYTVQDLGKAISQLGMRVLEVAGSRDTRARFYGSASPDIWIVAEKK